MVFHMLRHVESSNSRLHGETCYLPCKPDLHGASHAYMVDQQKDNNHHVNHQKQSVAENSSKQQQTAATGGKQEQNT